MRVVNQRPKLLLGLRMRLVTASGRQQQLCPPQVIDPEHLSVQLYEEENQITLFGLMEAIADSRLSPLHLSSDQGVGQFCLALYHQDCMYYRAQIEVVNWERREVEVSWLSAVSYWYCDTCTNSH